MIRSFRDQATRDLYDGIDSKAARRIPKAIWAVVRRKVDWLDLAREVADLASPPGNRLEKLRGDRSGFFSIRVNDQYRLVFRFEHGNAHDVQLTDYH